MISGNHVDGEVFVSDTVQLGIEIQKLLQFENVLAYFQQLPKTKIVGERESCGKCPLALYFLENSSNLLKEVEITNYLYFVSINDVELTVPPTEAYKWVQDFVEKVDKDADKHRTITAGKVVRILEKLAKR